MFIFGATTFVCEITFILPYALKEHSMTSAFATKFTANHRPHLICMYLYYTYTYAYIYT